VAEPSVNGNIQLQQMSVIGFMNRPWQVGPACAEVARPARLITIAMVATSRRSNRVKMALQEFIDA
jgi:hypothetical protein